MATRSFTDAEMVSALRQTNGSRVKAAEILGITPRGLLDRIRSAKAHGVVVPDAPPPTQMSSPQQPSQAQQTASPLVFPTLPDGKVNIRELIDRRKAEFERKNARAEAYKLVSVKVRTDQPIGVVLLGDPHVDDPGTDLGLLERDLSVIAATDGLYAGCIGDLHNNWVGRLARLYEHQETTSAQAWQLVEWLVQTVGQDWLFMVSGNHDNWSGSGDPLRWIQRQAHVKLTGDHTVRLGLRFPNGREIRIAARHDWPGNSMWNPSHGQLRAANLTHHDHIIVSGHKHTGGYQMIKVPASGLVSHCIQLGSYKIHDSYADELGLPPRMISPSTTAIIDPAGNDISAVRIEHDIEAAADYLTWLRAKRA